MKPTGWAVTKIGGGIVDPHRGLSDCIVTPPRPPSHPPSPGEPPNLPSPNPSPPPPMPPPMLPEAVLKVNIFTDKYPTETSWVLVDAKTGLQVDHGGHACLVNYYLIACLLTYLLAYLLACLLTYSLAGGHRRTVPRSALAKSC